MSAIAVDGGVKNPANANPIDSSVGGKLGTREIVNANDSAEFVESGKPTLAGKPAEQLATRSAGNSEVGQFIDVDDLPWIEYADERTAYLSAEDIKIVDLGRELGRGGCGIVRDAKITTVGGKKYSIVVKQSINPSDPNSQKFIEHEVRMTFRVERSIRDTLVIAMNDKFFPDDGKAPKDPEFFTLESTKFIVQSAFAPLSAYERSEGKIFMEKIENSSLLAMMESGEYDNFSKSDRALIAAQAAAGLSFLHKSGIVQRDFKPHNIMYDPHGKEIKIKLIDFGLAEQMGAVRHNCIAPIYNCAIEELMLVDKFPKKSPAIVEHPTADVYTFGMQVAPFLFGREGLKVWIDLCRNKSNARDVIAARIKFSQKLGMIFEYLNNKSPAGAKYTGEELAFAEKIAAWCMNPNPMERPTAAQIACSFEMLSAGCTDFDEAKQLAKKWRKMREDYFLDNIILVYKTLGLVPNNATNS
jgi:serine/threonine protein kinase